MPEYTLKYLVVGASEVGKTSLIKRYVEGEFTEGFKITIGVDFLTKIVQLPNAQGKTSRVTFQVWDIAGQAEFTNFSHLYMKNTHCVFLVFDLSRPETYNRLQNWKKQVVKTNPNVFCVVVGNKSDLVSSSPIPEDQVLSELEPIDFFLTSAKTGSKVEETFILMGKKILSAI